MLQQFSLGIATVGTYGQIPAGLCVYSYIEDIAIQLATAPK